MTDYTKIVNFAVKDGYTSGNPLKTVKGTEINTELANVETHVATKANKITSATANNLVMMDSNGDTIDSTIATDGAATVTAALVGDVTGNVTGNATGSSGSCTGNSATATNWDGSRTITLTGDVTGATANSSGTKSIATTLAANSVNTNEIVAGAVQAETATSLVGTVGTYAFLYQNSGGTITPGTTRAGTGLWYSDTSNYAAGTKPGGNWRCMGHSTTNTATLWLRYS